MILCRRVESGKCDFFWVFVLDVARFILKFFTRVGDSSTGDDEICRIRKVSMTFDTSFIHAGSIVT